MNSDPEVQLRLPARPENVAVVRQALAGMADALDVESIALADMKTAVTEACNNVVMHAYEDAEGTLEVDATQGEDGMIVVVRDYGTGMQPRMADIEEPTLGLGLPLIATLTDRFEIRGGSGLGMEVTMMFPAFKGRPADDGEDWAAGSTVAPDPPTESSPPTKAAGLALTPGPMMASILGRVTSVLGARADFSLDRLSDAVLVTDAISAHAGSYVRVMIQDGNGALNMRVGPLASGGGKELVRHMQLPGFERSIENLADEVAVEKATPDGGDDPIAEAEYLVLKLSGT
jgi:serine/threonine-protein kinase RsbW